MQTKMQFIVQCRHLHNPRRKKSIAQICRSTLSCSPLLPPSCPSFLVIPQYNSQRCHCLGRSWLLDSRNAAPPYLPPRPLRSKGPPDTGSPPRLSRVRWYDSDDIQVPDVGQTTLMHRVQICYCLAKSGYDRDLNEFELETKWKSSNLLLQDICVLSLSLRNAFFLWKC